jgi:hypothetical protein
VSENVHHDQVEQHRTEALASRRLKEAFAQGRLTLYLGAGCSVASRVPSWDQLVTQLYVNGIARRLPRFASIPALISAVGHWAFARQVLPLEVAARKLRGYYGEDSDLLFMIKMMLYGLTDYLNRDRLRPAEIRQLLANNHTLRAISRLCRETLPGKRGVRAVITYNYDDLLEKSLGRFRYQSVWRAPTLKPRRLPIFHVHGYLPAGRKDGCGLDEIVLTEDQYNRAVQNPYSWQNLVQIHSLSGSVGLMVGLSLSDRNLRSLLDALRNLPERAVEAYALLPRPKPWKVGEADVAGMIAEMKARIRDGWEVGYDPTATKNVHKPGTRKKIVALVRELESQDLTREEAMLAQLGVRTIWYEDHAEIERFMERLLPLQGPERTD